jgi:urea transporter/murein DD-endopeptidase MepM/ murein hydrolase activator NlpD
LLVVSFFDIGAGVSGIIAIIIGQITALLFNFNHELIRNGTYTYNALMVGMAIGIFYDFNLSYLILLIVASILTFFITIWFSTSLGHRGLPFLSIPFLLVVWIIILGSDNFTALELHQKETLSLARYFPELFTNTTDFIGKLPFSNAIYLYLRSMGAIFFQFNDLAGLFIAIGILIYSRISFVLSVFGFTIGYLFYYYLEGDFSQLIYSYIGFNFILTAIALGGFFVIPSKKSFLILILTIPIIALLISALHTLFQQFGLPLYSLPFNIVVLLFLSAMALRFKSSGLQLVTLQQFSPEKNHYKYYNSLDRFSSETYFHISLPIIGDWRISQGYDGKITHKGEWAQALDFDVISENGKTFKDPGNKLKDYYCYDLPVTTPAFGWVVEIIDDVEDNEIGDVNLDNNWGNTIVIKHGENIYSKLSHLKKDTIQVKVDDTVNKGDVIAYCGSSGRSPEPHLHFQLQATPFIGSKTIKYPISYYLTKQESEYSFHSFNIPKENDLVSNVQSTKLLKDAFHFIPGKKIKFEITEVGKETYTTDWEIFTTPTNTTYIYCHKTKATAYFVNNGTLFYFTDFYGNKKSFLHYFYIVAHKILLGYYKGVHIKDKLLIDAFFPLLVKSVHDFTAPFFHYCKADYSMQFLAVENEHQPTKIECSTHAKGTYFGKVSGNINANIIIENDRLKTIELTHNDKKITAVCVD